MKFRQSPCHLSVRRPLTASPDLMTASSHKTADSCSAGCAFRQNRQNEGEDTPRKSWMGPRGSLAIPGDRQTPCAKENLAANGGDPNGMASITFRICMTITTEYLWHPSESQVQRARSPRPNLFQGIPTISLRFIFWGPALPCAGVCKAKLATRRHVRGHEHPSTHECDIAKSRGDSIRGTVTGLMFYLKKRETLGSKQY